MGERVFAVGDIHGCARELEVLLAGLPLASGDTIVFVGDYIDRGPESRAVIEQLLELRGRAGIATVFLKGNHEDMCLAYLGRPGHWGESWHVNGGGATLRSYGLDGRPPRAEIMAALPDTHLEFLEGLDTAHVLPDHLFVHAGVHPDRAWEEQVEEDLFWIREEFLQRPHRLPQTVVYGHTPHRRVMAELPHRIGIDTGCVYGGRLTCLELATGTLHQVTLGEQEIRTSLLEPLTRRP